MTSTDVSEVVPKTGFGAWREQASELADSRSITLARGSRGCIPPASSDGISVVIPAFNEEARIGHALDIYLPVLERLGCPFEVIIVMDGTDKTPEVVKQYNGRNVVGVVSRRRLGKGGALLEGFGRAKFNVTGFVDADGSLHPDALCDLIARISEVDCVIGSRWLPGSRWLNRGSISRRISSRGFNLLVRGILGLPFTDTQCGAKFFRSEVLRKVLPEVTVTNLTVDVGLLYHARKAGARMSEVPVTWDHDDRSRFRLGKVMVLMLVTLVGIRLMNLRTSRLIPKQFILSLAQRVGNA